MINTKISIIIGIVLILSVGSFVYLQKDVETTTTQAPSEQQMTTIPEVTNGTTTQPVNETVMTPVPEVSTITSAQVATHNTRESCWSTINGNVYDLTSWVPKHPGGEKAILQLCGVNGSDKFNGKHGGAVKQAGILLGFKIGVASN